MRRLAIAAFVVALGPALAYADEPRAQLQIDGSPHVGVPITLSLLTEGFDENPQPDVPKIEIPGATVTFVGANPNVTHGIQIINGHRTDFSQVRWQFQWRVEVGKPGTLHIPSVTVVQGSKKATARAGSVEVETVPTTDDMKLELGLPNRAVFVGETIPVTLTWMFRAQPQDKPAFAVPLFDNDSFAVSFPTAANQRKALAFTVGGKEVAVPYDVDQTDVGGVRFNRVKMTVYAAPRKTGKVAIPPASVAVQLPVGRADFFGTAPSRLFRAVDVPRTLDVKMLPETDRPASFTGAVGKEFSIAVTTSRSVVQLGEPVELNVTVKSKQRLDTLALGRLDREGGLPKDKFTVPADPPTGELSDDGTTKTFKVTAQVIGPATEIPAIEFAYFDPEKERYATTKSDPIALSVKGGNTVGAGDVVAVTPKKSAGSGAREAEVSLVGADLALSSPGSDDGGPLGGAFLWIVLAILYAVPIALLVIRSWQVRTQAKREDAAEVKAARRRLEAELHRAQTAPARDTAGPLAAALRDLARVLERPLDDDGLLAKIETESFAPAASESPLSRDIRTRVDALVKKWLAEPRRASRAAVVALLVIAAVPAARADPITDGRAAYQDAMATTNPTQRKAAFARAAAALGEAARQKPDQPEVLSDWGNAALAAGDVATATLAYRRALAIDATSSRARRNLAWLRDRQPELFKPQLGGAADTLFFFHQWPRSRRAIVGAAAFAIAILVVVPWSGRRRRGMLGVAALPLAVWAAMMVSLVVEDRHSDDAIVMDGVLLRAADSPGAPATISQSLTPGTEVTILEHRDSWTRIRIASGTAGWVPDGAIQHVR
jgi:cytochrome c-type biogenesis protein CcmH/NrfG